MSWHPYDIDDCARRVVSQALARDPHGECLNQVFKMRVTCAYGLERFLGEYIRLKEGGYAERHKAEVIRDTWTMLCVEILADTGITLPHDDHLDFGSQAAVISSLQQLWELRTEDPAQVQIVLAVLTSFCEAIIWWKNRLA
jgi:hypothetical protein